MNMFRTLLLVSLVLGWPLAGSLSASEPLSREQLRNCIDADGRVIDPQLRQQTGWEVVRGLSWRIELEDPWQPGKFVPFFGYEWHSSSYGDVCIIFPGNLAELAYINGIRGFQKFARDAGAILTPHHPGYLEGWRGQNWSVLDP